MVSYRAELVFRARRFLDDHWAFKWFVMPIWFMGTVLFALMLVVRATALEAATLTAMYVGFSLAIVAVGLAVERVVTATVSRRSPGANRSRE